MKQAAFVLVFALAIAPAAWAGNASTQAGVQSVDNGARLSGAGFDAASHGNFIGGSVALPLGATSAASGAVTIVAGEAGAAAAEPIHEAFDKRPLPITNVTVTPQAAPVVPHDAQTK